MSSFFSAPVASTSCKEAFLVSVLKLNNAGVSSSGKLTTSSLFSKFPPKESDKLNTAFFPDLTLTVNFPDAFAIGLTPTPAPTSIFPVTVTDLTRFHGVLAPHYKHRKQIVPKPPELKLVQAQEIIEPQQLELEKKNIPWAKLLARVFNIDVETCIKCGGKMKIIAAIEDPKVIKKILEHLRLPTKLPPLQPARAPPSPESHFTDDFYQQHFQDFQ